MLKDKMNIEEWNAYQASLKNPGKKKGRIQAVKTMVDDILFDSGAESRRYQELILLHKAGEITEPVLQYRFNLPGGLYYTADFIYFDYKKREWIVEDFKGWRTETYIMRKKLLFESSGIKIFETGKKPPKLKAIKQQKKD